MDEPDRPDLPSPAADGPPPGPPALPGAPEPPGPPAPASPTALVFDLDGTLVDTVPTRLEAWLRTFDEAGIPADRAHLLGLIGADGKRLAREVAGLAGRSLDDDRAEAIDRRSGQLFSSLNTDPRPLPGAVDLLRALDAAGVTWAVATSSRPEQVMRSIEALDLGHTPRITDGSHVLHAKPAPDLLLAAAEQLDIPARRCWYVGDSTWDMLAARAAVMPGVGITTGAVDETQLRRAGALLTYPTLDGLAAELRARGLLPG